MRLRIGLWLTCCALLASCSDSVNATTPEQEAEAAPELAVEQVAEPDADPQPIPERPADQTAEGALFPSIAIDFENHIVDVRSTVCLNEGLLELVACIPDSREHESLVMIGAVPMHVHAAMLLAGGNNGNPAMAQPANEEQTRWIHLPPQGDPFAVSLVYVNEDGDEVERPISDFIRRATEEDFGQDIPEEPAPPGAVVDEAEDPAEVFAVFVFAGSQVAEDDEGNRHYLADYNGNVISISTFGDETLCLPWIQSRENGSLVWEANGEELPRVGTSVLLRLRLILPLEDGATE